LNNGFAVGPQGEPAKASHRTKFDGESVPLKAKNQPLGWFL